MILSMPTEKRILREILNSVLQKVNAKQAVREVVRLEKNILSIGEIAFDLDKIEKIYAVSIGKAAGEMSMALDTTLGDKLTAGIVSAPPFEAAKLSPKWTIFHGGHPAPNTESLAAARFVKDFLQRADGEKTLVIFSISGGGSAMFEMAKDEKITLEDLREANKILIACGATISEINAIRRQISAVKGGGLASFAPRSQQISLIISDTNAGEAFNVASGLTIFQAEKNDLREIVRRYDLREKLPPKIFEILETSLTEKRKSKTENHPFFVLRENLDALLTARIELEKNGFVAEFAEDFNENEIGEGCAGLVKKVIDLRGKTDKEKPVAIVSGGEFVCPVRGTGRGGRNLESALRTAILFDEFDKNLVALFAGTDGIDGNSPATGAICDQTTLARARALNLNAEDFLAESDSYSFFLALGDAIEIGATGTNVRDVRILLAL